MRKKTIAKLLFCLYLIIGIPLDKAKANLSWECTQGIGVSQLRYFGGGFSGPVGVSKNQNTILFSNGTSSYIARDLYNLENVVCTHADITGSISASLSSGDITNIKNGLAKTSDLSSLATSAQANNLITRLGTDGIGTDTLFARVNQARANAANAESHSAAARDASQLARDRTVYGDESAAKLAYDARQNAADARTDIANVNTNLTNKIDGVQSSIGDKIDNIETNITNIANAFPPTLTRVSGYNNATATTSGYFKLVIDHTNALEFRYRVGSGGWSDWLPIELHDNQGYYDVHISSSGANTVSVEIRKSEDGPVARGRVNVFRVN